MFSFKMLSQVVLFQNAYTLFTYHAYDTTYILNKPPLLCPLLLKYSVFFFL